MKLAILIEYVFVCFCYGDCLLICSIAEWKELQWNFDEEYFFWATCWTVLYFWCFGNSRLWRLRVCFLMLIQWWMTQELNMWFAVEGVFLEGILPIWSLNIFTKTNFILDKLFHQFSHWISFILPMLDFSLHFTLLRGLIEA